MAACVQMDKLRLESRFVDFNFLCFVSRHALDWITGLHSLNKTRAKSLNIHNKRMHN